MEASTDASFEENASESDMEEVVPMNKKAQPSGALSKLQQRSSARSKGPVHTTPAVPSRAKPDCAAQRPAISVKVTTTAQKASKAEAAEEGGDRKPKAGHGIETVEGGDEEISEASQRRKAENIKAMLGKR